MILLTKVRLINWYAFSHETAPIGQFTLIAGKNGNGKSVLLDAIKYAAYGDTIFNKSSESKGSRTLYSYTRGLLDATAGTYMRPAERYPNVYTHIVLEYHDELADRYFILGTVIETSASNNYRTRRYVMNDTRLDEVSHTYMEEGREQPYSADGLQKAYSLIMMDREKGLPKFLQMTGMKMGLSQLPAYLRRLRGIMTYDPTAKVDRFIRDSVLEEKPVDFTKLIEAKANIDKLNHTFQMIEEEVSELDGILKEYDLWEREKDRLLMDDIKQCYKKKQELEQQISRLAQDRQLASRQKEEITAFLRTLDKRARDTDERLIQAQVNLNAMDCAKMIAEEQRHLESLQQESQRLQSDMDELERFQQKVKEMLSLLKEDESLPRSVLMGLCERSRFTSLEKETAIEALKSAVDETHDKLIDELGQVRGQLKETNAAIQQQLQIIEECRKHRSAYSLIPEYVGLREEINQEFKRRGIASEAKFACEYVIALQDEAWRDAIEAFLGPRRYTILVDPRYYDIADDVLNRSAHKYAHLFNTKLLIRKTIEPQKDSPVHFLRIRNEVAQRYFDYQLGRMHAMGIHEVRNYENAISKEGRVSVAMDSYFLRFDRIRSYYLGQESFELNRIRAEKAAERLNAEKRTLLLQQEELTARKNMLKNDREFFRSYRYDAHDAYQKTMTQVNASKQQLAQLIKAQEDNQEYMELFALVGKLRVQSETIKQEQDEQRKQATRLDARIDHDERMLGEHMQEQEQVEQKYHAFETAHYALLQRAVEAYEKYLQNGSSGSGGLLLPQSRTRTEQRIEKAKEDLIRLQSGYQARYPDSGLRVGIENRKQYAARKDRIWMDDLQETRKKLDEQTRRYEEIFKNEFVLMILKSCERAKDELREINIELAKLNFSSKYQFAVDYVKDGSEYMQIIRYARCLDEREQLGGMAEQGMLDLDASHSQEEAEQLERELRRIINRVIETNSEETIARFADYRNYMTYEILITNEVLDHAKLSRQTGYNSGAEVQIPYLLILTSALLMIYNQKTNSTRLVFIDEPFAKMDPGNVKIMLEFMRRQELQLIFCSPDKTETIGDECEVILPVLRIRPDIMRMGVVQFHEREQTR